MAEIICPGCGKANKLADAEGHVEGPREFHAECWRRLCVAAPKLLRIVIDLIAWCELNSKTGSILYKPARAAFSEATGKS